ncbi:sugar ABC transporter substrate-binding protein [Ferdinandcohnia quinoae]|uniref:Maltodextrin-binding protein n=1 Tax=Fredinandcohnia quinoae TaxID=2918902 RepID=A0AAW5DZR6_9BACI|nr:maltose ABC transporter substrate-binding protein [Fredinandcohnia sp. SECRCQ15]MCH1626145.1 maltose ABC transporter substrate-binding protein [Fredinandcohnia sp. SECRCQ15]
MQRFLKLSFLALLVFSVLVACSKPGASTEPKDEGKKEGEKTPPAQEETVAIEPEEGASLIMWDNADGEMEWAQYVAEEFTKKYDIPVEVQEVSHVDAAGKLETDGPAGLGADVFHAPHDHVGNMVSSGLILENMFPDEYKENFMEAAINGTSYTEDGESTLYGYPIAIETYALYYNKDLVEKPATTFEELFAQAKEFQKDSTDKDRKFGLMMEVGNYYYAHAFLGGYGGYIFGSDNTDPSDVGLNNEGAVKAGEFMRKYRNELLPLKNEDITADIISSFFNNNQLLYRISGPWDITNHKDAGINFGVAPLPKLDNGEVPTSFSGIKGYYVNAYSKYPKAATLLAQFATSEEMLAKRFEITGQIPPHKALLENDALKADEYAMAFLEQAQSAVPMPNIPEMQTVWDPMGKAFVSIWNEEVDVKEILDAAAQQVKDAVASQQK